MERFVLRLITKEAAVRNLRCPAAESIAFQNLPVSARYEITKLVPATMSVSRLAKGTITGTNPAVTSVFVNMPAHVSTGMGALAISKTVNGNGADLEPGVYFRRKAD